MEITSNFFHLKQLSHNCSLCTRRSINQHLINNQPQDPSLILDNLGAEKYSRGRNTALHPDPITYAHNTSIGVVQSTNVESMHGRLRPAETTSSRGCVPSLLSEVSLTTTVRPRGTACPSQSAEHHPRQPSSDNSKHFYSVTLLALLYNIYEQPFKSAQLCIYELRNAPMVF